MTDRSRHPLLARALDRSRPLDERKAAYRRWADEHQPHIHPGRGWHTHAAGNQIHDHREEKPR